MLSEIEAERLKLRAEIGVWRDDQALYMPESLALASESPLPEDDRLRLPSDIPTARRDTQWYKQLSGFEMDLRKGQADDALSNLRLALKYKDSLEKGRRRVAYGNRNSTRAAVLIRRVQDLVLHRAETYRRARKAMIALGMSPTDTKFPELQDAHITLKVIAGAKELGDGKYTGSWIWAKGPRGILSDAEEDEWEEEGEHLHSCLYITNAYSFQATKLNGSEPDST